MNQPPMNADKPRSLFGSFTRPDETTSALFYLLLAAGELAAVKRGATFQPVLRIT
jgi:hypothetical protein